MKKLPLFLTFAVALCVTSAFAGEGKGDTHPVQSQEISWDQFKARCAHPGDFDAQVPPENISISCTNVETGFVPMAPGSFRMESTRQVSAQVFSSKWHVGGTSMMNVPVEEKGGSCARFKEVQRTLTEVHQLSCQDILGIKGDIQDYCVSVLDQGKASHPKLIESRDTGRVLDTCGGIQMTTTSAIAGHNKTNWE